MARPAEFDRTRALEHAMKLFWVRGYAATSLPDLLTAMGIARSSFYASFKTKRALFMECLELFGDRTLAIVVKEAANTPAIALPRTFFQATLLDVSRRKAHQGCLMVNTVLELADVDRELHELASTKLDAIESAFARAFEQAQRSGQLDAQRNAQELAALVMVINLGLRVQSRKKQSLQQLRVTLESSLSMLELAA